MMILRFILEVTVELGLVSFICALRIEQVNFFKFWDAVSTLANLAFLALLLGAPLFMIYLVRKYFKDP